MPGIEGTGPSQPVRIRQELDKVAAPAAPAVPAWSESTTPPADAATYQPSYDPTAPSPYSGQY